MNLTDMVIMPGDHYQDACNAIREKTGGTNLIRSGEMAELIRSIETGAGNVQYFTLPIGRSRGDVNGDGRITFADYYMISDHVMGVELITDEVALWCADTDGSGSVGVTDMILVDQYIQGDLSVSDADYYGNWTHDSTNGYYFVDIPVEGITAESKATLLVPAHADTFVDLICMDSAVRVCAAICPGEEMKCCLFVDEDGKVLNSAPLPEVEKIQTSVTINSTNYDQRVRLVYADEAGERGLLSVSAGATSKTITLPTPSMVAIRFAPNVDVPDYSTVGGFVDEYDGFTFDTSSGPEYVILFFVRGDVEFVLGEEA